MNSSGDRVPDNSGSESETDSSNSSQPNHPNGKTPVYIIIIGILLTVLVIVCLQVDDWSRDWTNNFAETREEATDLNLRPIHAELEPAKLADLVFNRMQNATRWTVSQPVEQPDGSWQIELVHKTFLMGFKDDVQVTIQKTQTGSHLSANSQSRIGKGDLGQNPRNLKELISLVRQSLPDPPE